MEPDHVITGGFPGGSAVKNLPAMQDQSLGWKNPLEEGMTTHSSILAWRIPGTEELGRLQSMRLQRVGHDWSNRAHKCHSHLWGTVANGLCTLFQLDAIIPPLQMRKLGQREVNYLVPGYIRWRSELGPDPTLWALGLPPKSWVWTRRQQCGPMSTHSGELHSLDSQVPNSTVLKWNCKILKTKLKLL